MPGIKEDTRIPGNMTEESFKERFIEWAAKDPIKAVKAFAQTKLILNKINPTFYLVALYALKDLVGEERLQTLLTFNLGDNMNMGIKEETNGEEMQGEAEG